VISSSKVDTLAMASAFYPLSYNDVWMTGLPRNDFILRDQDLLPEDMRGQLELLRNLLQGRRLVLFVPTFKHGQGESYYHFTDEELAILEDWLRQNNAVLGVREHMADRARTYNRMLCDIGAINLGDYRFPNIEVLYREAAVLVTDYSSCFIDFMLTGKPMVSFAYDYDSYVNRERGLFYDMDFAFPGPVAKDFDQLIESLTQAFGVPGERAMAEYEWKRRLFFDYCDDQNASRVVDKVKALYQETPDRAPGSRSN
jgi:CDP-glycerol glycerophosphotransferase (TagB/SpsB family)